MSDFFLWFTRPDNSKLFVLILFFVVYTLIILYVFTNKKRSKRLESYKNIPFEDGDETTPKSKDKEHE
ncbi:MAG: cbb3-type cytochrome c oxidase subunit 3 [Gammaproteobacteria bacterium]|nr:cbb3-type cytochrome c oxidase subunit 3 [Gammaproteobacteria bacterium]